MARTFNRYLTESNQSSSISKLLLLVVVVVVVVVAVVVVVVCVCVFIKLHITAQSGCRTIPSMLLVWILPMGDVCVCVCGHHFQETGHQPGVVANPA